MKATASALAMAAVGLGAFAVTEAWSVAVGCEMAFAAALAFWPQGRFNDNEGDE